MGKEGPLANSGNGGKAAICCDTALVEQLKALAHPARMDIVRHLLDGRQNCCGEICACVPLAQSTVSQHLDQLKKAGLVTLLPDGTRSLYSIDGAAFAALAAKIENLAAAAGNGRLSGLAGEEAL